MYIVASPRSGGTAYSILHATEHNLTFKGELSPAFVFGPNNAGRSNYKSQHHETGMQPDYELDEYLGYRQNLSDPANLFLVTTLQSTPSEWENASAFITRRNLVNIVKSQVDFHARLTNRNLAQPEEKIQDFYMMTVDVAVRTAMSIVTMLRYCKLNNKEIVWYEDVFQQDTQYETYESWTKGPTMLNRVLQIYKEFPVTEWYPDLIIE